MAQAGRRPVAVRPARAGQPVPLPGPPALEQRSTQRPGAQRLGPASSGGLRRGGADQGGRALGPHRSDRPGESRGRAALLAGSLRGRDRRAARHGDRDREEHGVPGAGQVASGTRPDRQPSWRKLMSDEQRVRDALAYELEPWQPNAADLMRRGKRLAWVRRGLAAAGVTALAGTVATVSAAVGGPAPVKNMLAGGGKPPVPVVVPTPMPQTPSVDPTCLPTVPARPQLPKVTVSVSKTIDPNAVPTGKPTLPAKPSLPPKPSLPTTRPSLPGKLALPT